MSRSSFAQLAWLACIAVGVVLSAVTGRDTVVASAAPAHTRGTSSLRRVTLPDGRPAILDASGEPVPVRAYRHVASGSSVADEILLRLLEPERIASLTTYGREHGLTPHLYGTRPATGKLSDVERLRAEGVDLLVLHHLGAPAELARARDAGIVVLNLGDMRGLATLLPNVELVAAVLGCSERAEHEQRALARRMRAVAADLAPSAKKRALYVTTYGGQLFGGTGGSSYHDVLVAAGLVDAAAERYKDWPHYDPEELLALDPELIVTTLSSRSTLCSVSGLSQLRACAAGGRGVIALDDALLGNPGFTMLDAAEALHDAVYAR